MCNTSGTPPKFAPTVAFGKSDIEVSAESPADYGLRLDQPAKGFTEIGIPGPTKSADAVFNPERVCIFVRRDQKIASRADAEGHIKTVTEKLGKPTSIVIPDEEKKFTALSATWELPDIGYALRCYLTTDAGGDGIPVFWYHQVAWDIATWKECQEKAAKDAKK